MLADNVYISVAILNRILPFQCMETPLNAKKYILFLFCIALLLASGVRMYSSYDFVHVYIYLLLKKRGILQWCYHHMVQYIRMHS